MCTACCMRREAAGHDGVGGSGPHHVWTAPVEQGVFYSAFADQVRFIHVYGLLHAARGRWP
jgi:hypothetical protein